MKENERIGRKIRGKKEGKCFLSNWKEIEGMEWNGMERKIREENKKKEKK